MVSPDANATNVSDLLRLLAHHHDIWGDRRSHWAKDLHDLSENSTYIFVLVKLLEIVFHACKFVLKHLHSVSERIPDRDGGLIKWKSKLFSNNSLSLEGKVRNSTSAAMAYQKSALTDF